MTFIKHPEDLLFLLKLKFDSVKGMLGESGEVAAVHESNRKLLWSFTSIGPGRACIDNVCVPLPN